MRASSVHCCPPPLRKKEEKKRKEKATSLYLPHPPLRSAALFFYDYYIFFWPTYAREVPPSRRPSGLHGETAGTFRNKASVPPQRCHVTRLLHHLAVWSPLRPSVRPSQLLARCVLASVIFTVRTAAAAARGEEKRRGKKPHSTELLVKMEVLAAGWVR